MILLTPLLKWLSAESWRWRLSHFLIAYLAVLPTVYLAVPTAVFYKVREKRQALENGWNRDHQLDLFAAYAGVAASLATHLLLRF